MRRQPGSCWPCQLRLQHIDHWCMLVWDHGAAVWLPYATLAYPINCRGVLLMHSALMPGPESLRLGCLWYCRMCVALLLLLGMCRGATSSLEQPASRFLCLLDPCYRCSLLSGTGASPTVRFLFCELRDAGMRLHDRHLIPGIICLMLLVQAAHCATGMLPAAAARRTAHHPHTWTQFRGQTPGKVEEQQRDRGSRAAPVYA